MPHLKPKYPVLHEHDLVAKETDYETQVPCPLQSLLDWQILLNAVRAVPAILEAF